MRTEKKYRAREGWRISDKDAEVVGRFLEENFPTGNMTALAVVELASHRDCPIHKFFEWDDAKAAHQFRIEQARHLIRSVVVDVGGSEVPAFHRVHIEESETAEYVEVGRAMADADLWAQVIETAMKEAQAWSARYQTYAQLNKVHKAIQETKKELERANRSTKQGKGKDAKTTARAG